MLSVSGLPAGITASFEPQQITAGQSAVLTLTAASGQPVGTSHITITANASVEWIPLSSSAPVTVNLQAAGNVAFAGHVAVTGDPYDTPIVGLTVRFIGVNYTGATTGCNASVQTDASGNFLFSVLPYFPRKNV